MNIKFTYLYRDASNYKQHHEVVFANPNEIALEEIQTTIKSKLIDECWFIARDWNLPDMHFKEYDWDDKTDHEWHEYQCIKETTDAGTAQTIEDFIEVIKVTTRYSLI